MVSCTRQARVGKTSTSIIRLCYVAAARENGTTTLLSMSLEAFEHALRTLLREVLSQYTFLAAVERPGPGRPLLCRPLTVFSMLMPGSSSVGSGPELSSVLEVEPTLGELSSMPEPECASEAGVGLTAIPVGSEEQEGPSPSSSCPVRSLPTK